MEQRLDLLELAPEAYEGVFALEAYARGHVDPHLFELIKIRASMINGCAYCVDMHTTDALKQGEDLRRIVALAAWHESPYFSVKERAVLALTDSVTRMGEGGVSDEVWGAASEQLADSQLAAVLMAIAVINVWNRLAVSSRLPAAPLT